MIKLNKAKYLDKLYASWLGKNIGGTIGAPYEGTKDFLNVEGFTTPEGEPMPNDDLDLQLVWLGAMEQIGPMAFGPNTLPEYWLDWIVPHWNEYGISKANMRMGILPPMSGEVENEKWRNSNGAWIRSEIWAGLAPGVPEVAAKYAFYDASVDHGVGEGTVAEIFTATLQSYAYVESDLNKIIDFALSQIPDDSLVARSVRLAVDCYNSGMPLREARDTVMELSSQLGWFQAPANIGFVVLGLLYGEGDFKKSVLAAVNCGDDTDCTGATVGATLGIMYGTAGIPEDWRSFVGDSIVTICINCMYRHMIPKTCTQLTERVAKLMPDVLRANYVNFEFTDGEDEVPAADLSPLSCALDRGSLDRGPYSYDIDTHHGVGVRVELDAPTVRAGEERKVTLTFFCKRSVRQTVKLLLRPILTEGWSVNGMERSVTLEYPQPWNDLYGVRETSMTITAAEQVESVNRVYIEVTSASIASPIIVPITFVG